MMRRWLPFLPAIAFAFAALFSVAPAQAGVDIRVNLATQTLTATTPDGDVRRWAISSGRAGYRTIRGSYRPYMLKTYHWSRKYGGHMPHAIFFKGGFAIHGTNAVGRLGAPASHGCIRLAPGAARELFQLVRTHGQRSTRIAINGTAPDTGRTMVAERKVKQKAQVARAKIKQQPSFQTIPAFAPQPYEVPANRIFQRLR